MLAERWKEVKPILSAALELDPTLRPAFLLTACSGDASLMQEVQSLIDAYAEGASQLERPAGIAPGLSPGDKLGNYEIEALIGAGGMGEVYRAIDVTLGLAVAIKVLPPALSSDPGRLWRLEQEARAAAALSHPNILYVHRLDTHEGLLYIVSELLEGQTLRALMQRGGLQIANILDYAFQTASGIAAAHNKGIVHRDIKPENLFVTQYGQIKILDFGLAKGSEAIRTRGSEGNNVPDRFLTKPGAILGTTAYMSPEQVRGREAGPQSDIFSFGVVLYEMATGALPFQGETPAVVCEAIMNRAPVAPRSLSPGVPPELERIILRALEKDLEMRYRDGSEIRNDLQALQPRSGSNAAYDGYQQVLPHPKRASLRWRRVPWTLLVFLAVAAIAAIIGRQILHWDRGHALTEKDTIVLADFTNNTGEPVFDDALKEGLSVDLQQSKFLNLLSESEINKQLGYMGRPEDQPLTPEIAREVCLREGSKSALFSSISSLGNHYVITLKAVNCQNLDVLDEEQGEADRREKVLAMLHDLGRRLRGKLGESLESIKKNDTSLEEATTPSLEALQAYSMATRTFRSQGVAPAIPLYKRAIQLDPDFAQAYADLSVMYTNRNEYSLSVECATKAYRLRDKVSEPERFSIDSIYYGAKGRLEKEAEVLGAWKRGYPRMLAPYVNLGIVDANLGRVEQALEDDLEGFRLNPDTAALYSDLADDYLSLNRLPDAEAILQEASKRKLEPMLAETYQLAFLKNDDREMSRLLHEAQGKAGTEDTLLASQAATEAFYGRLDQARNYSRKAEESAIRNDAKESAAGWHADAAMREAGFGNFTEAVQEARAALKLASTKQVETASAMALAQAGELAKAISIAAALEKDFPEDTILQNYWLPSIRAAIAIHEKRYDRAIEFLQVTTPYELGGAPPPFAWGATMYPVYLRGEAYLASKQWDKAQAEFQKMRDHSGLIGNFPLGALSILQFARACSGANDTAKALRSYQEFLKLWAGAPEGTVLLRRARLEYSQLH